MDIIREYIDKIFNNKYTSTILTMFLVLYGGLARPKLPPIIKNIFKKTVFRVVLLSLIVYNGNKNVKLSISMAILFIIAMHHLNNDDMEQFSSNADSCYLNCMKDTLSYLTTEKHEDEVVKMENWFNINKMLIKEYTNTLDLNKVWTKVPKTVNKVSKNVAVYIDTKNIYDSNTLHQEIQTSLMSNKNNIITKHGEDKYKEIKTKMIKGQKLLSDSIRSYTMMKNCKEDCKNQ